MTSADTTISMPPATPETEKRGGDSCPAICSAYRMARVWAMPNLDTLQVPEIQAWVRGYLMKSKISADPFARNCRLAQWRNDLNPETAAEHHMDSVDFLTMLKTKGVQPDCVIFDPPYSHHQIKVSYDQVGRARTPEDVSRMGRWTKEKDIMREIQPVGGIVLQLGWNSAGMGEKRGYDIIDVLLVCHGTGHNDTICIAERKREPERTLWDTRNSAICRPDAIKGL